MNPLLKKLHLNQKGPALVINAPEEFQPLLDESNVEIHSQIEDYYHYIQVFVQDEEEATDAIADAISALEPGGYFWFSYPKEKSDKYETDLDEKSVMEIFENFDMEGVTQVSIDDHWKAIRLKFSDDIEGDDFSMQDKGKRRFSDYED